MAGISIQYFQVPRALEQEQFYVVPITQKSAVRSCSPERGDQSAEYLGMLEPRLYHCLVGPVSAYRY